MRSVSGYAAFGPDEALRPIEFQRRDLRADDVAVRVTHVGVCHSDLHAVEGMAADAPPLVPGHEFTGVVTEVGADVTRFRAGDAVAVGNIVDSCLPEGGVEVFVDHKGGGFGEPSPSWFRCPDPETFVVALDRCEYREL